VDRGARLRRNLRDATTFALLSAGAAVKSLPDADGLRKKIAGFCGTRTASTRQRGAADKRLCLIDDADCQASLWNRSVPVASHAQRKNLHCARFFRATAAFDCLTINQIAPIRNGGVHSTTLRQFSLPAFAGTRGDFVDNRGNAQSRKFVERGTIFS